ncbi:MAG TPA: hypothetical protein DIW23_09320 [Anaerolineae bacterium]|nr:hypothetical protein [Anaerolineae bacterium]
MNINNKRSITYLILFFLLIIRYTQSFSLVWADYLTIINSEINNIKLFNFWGDTLFAILLLAKYPLIALIFKLNQNSLSEMLIDRLYIFLLLLAGIIGVYFLPYNIFFIIAFVYTLFLAFSTKQTFSNRQPLSYLDIILLFIFLFLHVYIAHDNMGRLSSFNFIEHLFVEIIPPSVFEEAIFRGIIFFCLFELRISNKKILIIQTIIFWLAHINFAIEAPLFFLIEIPIIGFILGYVALKSKSVSVSSVVHILINIVLFIA